MFDREHAIQRALDWAERYYPTRAAPPPDFYRLRLSQSELCTLFERAPSIAAHLALVDQEPVRQVVAKNPAVRAAAMAGWIAKGGYVSQRGWKKPVEAPPAAQTRLAL